jgi:hypothetical protein
MRGGWPKLVCQRLPAAHISCQVNSARAENVRKNRPSALRGRVERTVHRIDAARVARRFSAILDLLADGSMTLAYEVDGDELAASDRLRA